MNGDLSHIRMSQFLDSWNTVIVPFVVHEMQRCVQTVKAYSSLVDTFPGFTSLSTSTRSTSPGKLPCRPLTWRKEYNMPPRPPGFMVSEKKSVITLTFLSNSSSWLYRARFAFRRMFQGGSVISLPTKVSLTFCPVVSLWMSTTSLQFAV